MSKNYVNPYEDETVNKYFDDVKKYKLLKEHEEVEVARRIQDGD